MTIKENERYIDNQIFSAINKSIYNILNEDSGHPLFKYGDPDETFDWIDRIKNVMNIINDKIKTAKIKNRYKITVEETEESFIYNEYLPISISLNKLGFKDVINSQSSNLKIIIRDIVKGAEEFSNYLTIRDISSGAYFNSINRKLLNGKFINNDNNRDIMHAVCYAVNGKVIPISFLRVFLHEYLHFYEHYSRFIDNKGFKKTQHAIKWNDALKYINNFVFTKEEHKAIKFVLYHLYEGEDNAKIGELFSDLISLNIQDLSDLHKHKNDMFIFNIYDKLKESISIIKNCDTEELAKYIKTFPFFIYPRKFSISNNYNIENISDDKIVKIFINNLTDKLNKFYEKIMKFIGRFIYMQQEHENQTVTSIKQD